MNQAYRILYIFFALIENREICIKEVAKKFDINKRSVQRDMKILKEFLKESMALTKQGCYKLINKTLLTKLFLDIQDSLKVKDFFEFLTFFDNDFNDILEYESFDFIKDIQKNAKKIYHIHDSPIEKLSKTNNLKNIKRAISYHQYIDIVYFEKKRSDLNHIKPLKIVYAKGNWYLASMTKYYKTNGGFKFFRINFIEEVKVLSETFKRDPVALDFIQNFQSLFQNYIEPFYEVKLRVDKEIERHFRVKKYLKSQKNYPQKNGDIIVTYRINDDMEIIPLIKTWLPYVKVISPNGLKEKIKEDIIKFLD